MVSLHDSAMDEIPLQEVDERSIEFRVMMAFAQRNLSHSKYQHLLRNKLEGQMGDVPSNAADHKGSEVVPTPGKKKKKKSWRKRLTPNCLRPAKMAVQGSQADPETERARSIAQRLQDILQRITEQDKGRSAFRTYRQASLQVDGADEDELIASIAHILRCSGDKLHEQTIQGQSLVQRLQSVVWSYSFFKKLTNVYLAEAELPAASSHEEQTSKIALCIQATTKLTALDHQPMNKLLGFGAQYLKENYTPWIQSQGGWGAVMGIPGEENEEVE